jgi:hypothetical protein
VSNLIPALISYEQLAAVLADMAERVRIGDSFEGWIQYSFPERIDAPAGQVAVVGNYRIGNQQGQGGMRMIGTVPTGVTGKATDA